jgi:hypothetical protein
LLSALLSHAVSNDHEGTMTKERQTTAEVAPEHGGGAAIRSMAPPENVRLSDTDRLETFSDGIFAITITLLVFDIVRPDYEPGHLWERLLTQWPNYVAFLASFCYVGIIWLNHRAVFSRVRQCDRSLHLANLFLLLTSGLIPVSDRTVIGSASARQRFGRYYCRRDLRRRQRSYVSLVARAVSHSRDSSVPSGALC